jgi:hypothetical protein
MPLARLIPMEYAPAPTESSTWLLEISASAPNMHHSGTETTALGVRLVWTTISTWASAMSVRKDSPEATRS